MGCGRFRGKVICVYISLTHFIVQQKLIQHGKEITLQFKKRMQILHSTLKKKNKKTKVAEEWKLWKQQWGNVTNKEKRSQGCPHLLLGHGKGTHVKAEEAGKANTQQTLQQWLLPASSKGKSESGLLVLVLSGFRKVSFRRTVVPN